MGPWIVVVLAGGILSVIGMAQLILQYRRGEMRGPHLALLVGLYAIIVIIGFKNLEIAGFAFLVFWIPVFIAVHRPGKRHVKGTGGS